jgi:phosphoglycolate phosphatase
LAIRGILFDKDGTLIDYWATWIPINRKAALFAAQGDEALARELLRLGGHDPDTDRVVAGAPLAAGGIDDIARAFAQHPAVRYSLALSSGIERIFCSGGATHSALIVGTLPTLTELRARGFLLGVATNDSAAGLDASLAPHGVLPLLDFAVGCDSGFGAKPAPGMVLAFCDAIGAHPQEIAVVGDAIHDLAMGRAAGAGLTVGVLSGTSGREDLEIGADVILDSIVELLTHAAFRA